ncbi:fimbrial assembly protein FimA (plasmid) [Arthrobacter sp. ERGS1:01]|uniref:DUF1028 domain-containing protein n=1 Tax=Arthrobacter sp. ERGS1:01 TaxID=1704044 RepID=UPI0006B42BE4|nr:DUF1028 domain-containing protein [Arthrobacter sp. ERGS1:01]ALE04836.1 fimbrial assembly protein FimA [Arthrobacter sp. ERGS1:01]
MTFSIAGTDGGGRYGIAVTSSSPAVAARCAHLRDRAGVVSSQNITDPRLGTTLLDALEAGVPAAEALARLTAQTPDIEYRQIIVLDIAGTSAVFSGAHTLGTLGEGYGDGSVAAGNMLANDSVPQEMCDAFTATTGELEVRLLAALRAGLVAGGESGPLHSAGLSVTSGHGWPDTDLRVDWHDDPIDALGELLGVWLPQRDAYVVRGLDPAVSVGYGVPGDDR